MIGDNQSADRNLNIKAPSRHVKKTAPIIFRNLATVFTLRPSAEGRQRPDVTSGKHPTHAIFFRSALLRLARILRDLAASRVHAR